MRFHKGYAMKMFYRIVFVFAVLFVVALNMASNGRLFAVVMQALYAL